MANILPPDEGPSGSSTGPAVAAVVGGTHGLGLQLGRRARLAGMRTVVYGRSAGQLKDDPDLEPRSLDLTDPASIAACDVVLPRPVYVFWVAGAFLKKSLVQTTDEELEGLTRLLLTGPVRFLRRVLSDAPGPLHLITIASSSSWRRREHETLYCALKAAQAHFTRTLVAELVEAHPDNRVTLVNPGGLAVPEFHTGMEIDYGTMMDPDEVARIIWRTVTEQRAPFAEVQILRSREPGREGVPIVSFGPRAPEEP